MVPGKDDLLHPKKVSRGALDTQLKSGGNAAPALGEIVKLAPQWFPKGTRIEDVKENGDEVTVLLSPEFGNAKHWTQGETTTQLAIYSLVNTLAKDGKKVTLTLEGKPISALGEMDASQAFAADPSLNAPAKTSASAPTSASNTAPTSSQETSTSGSASASATPASGG